MLIQQATLEDVQGVLDLLKANFHSLLYYLFAKKSLSVKYQ